MEKAADAFRTISEVAEDIDVPQHVLRFWESRFAQIKPMKRGGRRRYYRPEDVDLLRGIRHLLYGEGYTIRGVQRILREQGSHFVQSLWQEGAEQPTALHSEESVHASEDYLDYAAGGEAALGQREPLLTSAPALRVSPVDLPAVQQRSALSRDDVRQLQTILHELTECRRVIEAVLKEGS